MKVGRIRHCGLALCVALLAAACGTDDSSDAAAAPVEQSSTTEAVVTDEATTTTTIDDSEPAAVQFPPPALPIKQVIEFDKPVWWFVARGGKIWADASEKVLRVDPDTGEREEALLPEPEDLRATLSFFVETDDMILASAQSRTSFEWDITVAFDTETFKRLGTIRVPFGSNLLVGNEQTADGFLAYKGLDSVVYELNTSTMTVGETALDFDFTGQIVHTGDEYWIWDIDGTVKIYDSAFELRQTVSSGREFGVFQHGFAYADDESVWHFDSPTTTLSRVDRESYEILDIDLSDRYGEDVLLTLSSRNEDLDLPLLVIRADSPGDGSFHILLRFDPDTGEVLSEHTIADASFEYGWWSLNQVDVSTDGDRVFIQDHPRRIVEIDMARLDDENTDPWVAPPLPWQPVLTSEEREVGELLLAMLSYETIPSTDPELYDLVIEALKAEAEQEALGGWEIHSATIDGDRAWAQAKPALGPLHFAAFTRVDGSWVLDIRGACYLTYDRTNPCEY